MKRQIPPSCVVVAPGEITWPIILHKTNKIQHLDVDIGLTWQLKRHWFWAPHL